MIATIDSQVCGVAHFMSLFAMKVVFATLPVDICVMLWFHTQKAIKILLIMYI
jgi:hypothetical protein